MNKASRRAAVALGVIALGLIGIRALSGDTYSRPAFEQAFVGATHGEVRGRLGAPDEIGGDTVTVWAYHRRTRNPATGRPDAAVLLAFSGGRVHFIAYRE
jgi:hypothetical protein